MSKLAAAVKSGESITIPGYEAELKADLFTVNAKSKDHIAEIDDTISVALDTTITDELKREGVYREILRQCQVIRKEAGFNVSDRVRLSITSGSGFINEVVSQYKDSLMSETLSSLGNVPAGSFEKEFDIDGDTVKVAISAE